MAVDLIKGRSAESVKPRLMEAPNRDFVEYVTQDFSLSYRAATVKHTKPKHAKAQKEAFGAAEEWSSDALQFLLFTESPMTEDSDPAEEARRIRMSRKELAAILPNAKIVGDHFHFKQAIVSEGFNAVRIEVKKSLKAAYYAKMKRHYLKMEDQKRLPDPKNIPRRVLEKAKKAVAERAEELDRYRNLLFQRESKLKPDGWQVVKRLLDDHPLLARAWAVKESGLEIFPAQPPLGRTKKSREAALTQKAKLRMTAEDAARSLDDWAVLVQEHEELKQFFKRALNMIRNWREELIRIGTTGYSNAATESKNRYLRRLASISRGLEFETLRARLLWADENHRTNRWPSICDDYDGEIDNSVFVDLAYNYLAPQQSAKVPRV